MIRCGRTSVPAGVLAWKTGEVRDTGGAVTLLRVVAVLLATSVVALADDAAANQLAAVPVPLAWRYGVRCGIATLAVAAPWAAALLWVRPSDLAAALSLECAALTAAALAVAGSVARWSGARDASVPAGPAVFGVTVLALALPRGWALHTTPGDGWAAAHVRWAGVLAAALTLLVPTVWDPARRRWWRDRRRRHPHAPAGCGHGPAAQFRRHAVVAAAHRSRFVDGDPLADIFVLALGVSSAWSSKIWKIRSMLSPVSRRSAPRRSRRCG